MMRIAMSYFKKFYLLATNLFEYLSAAKLGFLSVNSFFISMVLIYWIYLPISFSRLTCLLQDYPCWKKALVDLFAYVHISVSSYSSSDSLSPTFIQIDRMLMLIGRQSHEQLISPVGVVFLSSRPLHFGSTIWHSLILANQMDVSLLTLHSYIILFWQCFESDVVYVDSMEVQDVLVCSLRHHQFCREIHCLRKSFQFHRYISFLIRDTPYLFHFIDLIPLVVLDCSQ